MITIPRLKHPDSGLVKAAIGGRTVYRCRYSVDGRRTTYDLKASTVEEARAARDAFYKELRKSGGRHAMRKAKTVAATIGRRHKVGYAREPFIYISVKVRGVSVGSFRNYEEAIAARDEYVARIALLRKHLAEVKRQRA